MIQQTSLDCYIEVQEDKTALAQSQQTVYDLIKRYDNLTDSEIASILNWGINRVTPRRNELVKMGVISKYHIRPCYCSLCVGNVEMGISPAHRAAIAWRCI